MSAYAFFLRLLRSGDSETRAVVIDLLRHEQERRRCAARLLSLISTRRLIQ